MPRDEHTHHAAPTVDRDALFAPLDDRVDAPADAEVWQRIHQLLDRGGDHPVAAWDNLPSRYLSVWRAVAADLEERRRTRLAPAALKRMLQAVFDAPVHATVRVWDDHKHEDTPR